VCPCILVVYPHVLDHVSMCKWSCNYVCLAVYPHDHVSTANDPVFMCRIWLCAVGQEVMTRYGPKPRFWLCTLGQSTQFAYSDMGHSAE
jgi:hypothetical protein